MDTNKLIQGIQLLDKYRQNPGAANVGAEHDVIFAYCTTTPLSEVDIQAMIFLGWHQEHDERDYNEDMTIADYRHDESWHAYV